LIVSGGVTHAIYGLLAIAGILAVSVAITALWKAVIAFAQSRHDVCDHEAHGDCFLATVLNQNHGGVDTDA
jgi:hypothetical protein